MVEFALALPILLLVVYGLLETGRLLFIYASVVTGARQAARYGSASGDIGNGTLFYNDCNGIRGAANKVAFIQRFNSITINYDTGPGTTLINGCPISPRIADNNHRIDVTVTAQFTPIVPLVPFRPFTITSTSARTIITGVSVAVDQPVATQLPGGDFITLVKQATPPTFSAPGQTITYTIRVGNPTSDPITGINVTDPMFPNAGEISCPGGMPFSLAAGTTVTCTATHVITQAEVNAGQDIVNSATATGTNTLGVAVTATNTATVTFVGTASLELAKEGQAPGLIAAGQPVTYTFTLTNTGNVTLTAPFTIVDSLLGSSATCPAGTLDPGATMTCTGTHALTNSEISTGYINNSAHATATFAGATVISNTATAHTLTPQLFLSVSANKSSVSGPTSVTFTHTLTNRTSATVSSIVLTDQLPMGTAAVSICNIASLNAGASTTCTYTYNITQANIDAGSVFIDQAEATAKKISSNLAGVTITIVQTPVLTLTKTASPAAPPAGTTFILPATIAYNYSLKNSGNVTLKAPFTVVDDKLGVPCTIATGTLAPNATVACPVTNYPLTQADLDAGSIINHATATAIFASQTLSSGQVSATVITYTLPRMALVKTASSTFFTAQNQTLIYTYTLKNTGGVPITASNPYILTDSKIGSLTCGVVGTLPVGGSVVCKSANYVTTAADVTAKAVVNTVSPSAGSTMTPALTNSPSASLTIPLFVCDSTTVKGNGPIPDGSDVTWTITNSSGLPIHIASATIFFTGNPSVKLSSVYLNGALIWSGSGSTGIVLPGAPWTLNNGANPLRLVFSKSATAIRVLVGFSEASCSLFLDSNVP